MLPLVGSTIVPPGRSKPSRSAWRIISNAGRSFDEPPGLDVSIFIASTQGNASISLTRLRRTSGVFADDVDHGVGDLGALEPGVSHTAQSTGREHPRPPSPTRNAATAHSAIEAPAAVPWW